MACKSSCGLCKRLVISAAVTFDGTSLVINLPAGSYNNGEKYCIVVAQAIPAATTITAPVVITIGDGTEEYPLLTNRRCAQVLAYEIHARTRYSTCVSTDATGGTFRVLSKLSCSQSQALASIDGTAPAAEGGAGA